MVRNLKIYSFYFDFNLSQMSQISRHEEFAVISTSRLFLGKIAFRGILISLLEQKYGFCGILISLEIVYF